MKKGLFVLLAALLLLGVLPCAMAAEGDPLLSVDDMLTVSDAYEAFLGELEALLIERNLLSEDDRQAWRDAQMGDFLQNGGYGSILVSYMPGALDYAREEETICERRVELPGVGTLELETMRRYTPEDSSLSGLTLRFAVYDEAGVPLDAIISLGGTSGVFLKWDVLLGAYVSVGTTAQTEGETVVWSSQTPALGADDPIISVSVEDAETQEAIAGAQLTLHVDGDGYAVGELRAE